MTTYSAVASTEIDADSPITDALLAKLANNPTAITEGASGAPRVTAAALNTTTNTLTGSIAGSSNTTVTLGAFAFFPAVSLGGGDAKFGVSGASADGPKILMSNSTGSTVSYTIYWRSIL